ncbi:hypothetical protein TorRG33x02_319590 [Trema orientale]|uniref:Uncharacterized protein n=1 Tax=Trema orientale TaxID=63057 RepID=A0A2P5BIS5_TREOI|nr:hypothetical protein TorRG33x02_319590 [Trema orientale]
MDDPHGFRSSSPSEGSKNTAARQGLSNPDLGIGEMGHAYSFVNLFYQLLYFY